jgi:hypothetical protein
MTTAIDRITAPRVPTPAHLGQATAIEQSRAVAEVHAAIVVAQQCPRDVDNAIRQMERSCREPALAERAFYSFPKAGQTVTGESIHLARELARCWGNVQYGVAELRRDDEAGISEMQAYAWDVETNTRSAQIFIVPHVRDTKKGPSRLTDLRDVYENNANQGARRVREAIFAVLPPWFTERAKELCNQTLAAGDGESLEDRIAKAVQAFHDRQVTVAQLEAQRGRRRSDWTEQDVAQLGVLFTSIRRGEVTVDEAFDVAPVSTDELVGGAA